VFDGGSGDDHPAGAAADASGGLVAIANSGGGIRVFHYGPDNTLSWTAMLDNATVQLTNTLMSLNPLVAPDGSVYVTGRFSLPAGGTDLLVAKFAPSGAPAWVRTFDVGSVGGDEAPFSLLFGGGDLYVAGNIDTGSGRTIFALKLAGSGGTILWERIYPGVGPGGAYQIAEIVSSSSTALTGAGDLVAAVLFTKDPPDPVNGDSDDIRVIRYASGTGDNTAEWSFDSGGDEKPWAVGLDNAGNIYVAGRQRAAGTDYRFLLLKGSPTGGVDNVAIRPYAGGAVAKFLSFEGSDNVVIVGDSDNGTDTDVSVLKYRMSDLAELGGGGDFNSGGNDSVRAIATDSLGQLLAMANEGNDNVVLLKLGAGGGFSRELTYGAFGVSGTALAVRNSLVYLVVLQSNGLNQDMAVIAAGTPPAQVSAQGGSGGCFIATAAWGSPLAAEVEVLRRFRDRMLLSSGFGTRIVGVYYRWSPPVAGLVAGNGFLRATARFLLVPAVFFAFLCLQPVPVQVATLLATFFLLVPPGRRTCNIRTNWE
jgi:hypothetical protein